LSTDDSDDAMLARARDLIPVLAARESAAAAARCVPASTIEDFHAAGILRVLQPRRFGGSQTSFAIFSRVIEILAEGCAASAWVYAVLGEHQWIIACMSGRAQDDVWGENPLAVASSSLAPRETAEVADGGWRLSGRFPFSSGSPHAQWAIIGARAPDAAGNRPTRYMLVPMAEIGIDDDWHVLGLRGTASRTLVLRDVFVPEYRTVLLGALLSGDTPGAAILPDYHLLRAPRGYLVPFSLPTVSFTLARRALERVPGMLRSRLSRGTRDLSDSEVVQMRLGEASAAIDNAALIFHARRGESVASVSAGRAVTLGEVQRNRRDVTFAATQLKRGVEILVELTGARVVYDSDPLQTLLRDILTIDTHMVVSRQNAMVPYGRTLLGLPPLPGEA